MNPGFVIVGGGHAAAQLSGGLVQAGWSGPVTIVGEEPHAPYHRPHLSKSVLAGKTELAPLRPPDSYQKHGIEVRTGIRVTAIDRSARTVSLSDGSALPYGTLALCTGAVPRRLPVPGSERPGVYTLRSAADSMAIRAAARRAAHVVIVGGGYLGLEVASSLVASVGRVTVVEEASRVLARVAGPEVSAFFSALHRSHGVEIRCDSTVAEFVGDKTAGRVTGARLTDGEVVPADVVVVCVGVTPDIKLAAAAGLTAERGVLVDADGRTNDPHIFALGDCAEQVDLSTGARIWLQSVPATTDQARVVAAAAAGAPRPTVGPVWFWSDQYDLTLQIAGLSAGHERVVLRGDPALGSFVAWYLDGTGRLLAADCVRRPRDFAAARRMLLAGTTPDPAMLADDSSDLATVSA